MLNKRLITVTMLLMMATQLQACLYDDPDIDQTDDDSDVVQIDDKERTAEEEKALSHRIFYISNPNGKSYKLRITASIPSGTGKIDHVNIFGTDDPYSMITVSCGGVQSCTSTQTLYGCINYGTVPVSVEYTGSVLPRLTYWFYDCL